MATNPYFKNMYQHNEQNLSHDLVEEFIQLAGMDVYYMKVEQLDSKDFDALFGQNRFEVLKDATPIEMYLRNFEQPYMGFDMYGQVGVSLNTQIVFEVGYRRFESMFDGMRPREGDYIFIPASTPREMNDMFKIMYVETDDEHWNPQGTILKYILKCERATFAHQELKTGVEDIDYSVDPEMAELKGDPNADNELIQELGDMFIDFDEGHPFGKP